MRIAMELGALRSGGVRVHTYILPPDACIAWHMFIAAILIVIMLYISCAAHREVCARARDALERDLLQGRLVHLRPLKRGTLEIGLSDLGFDELNAEEVGVSEDASLDL